MKFGYFTHMPWPEGVSPKQVLDEVTEQVQVAESLGFYSAWLAEHHFTRYSIGSSSLIVATHIAAQDQQDQAWHCRAGVALAQPHSAG